MFFKTETGGVYRLCMVLMNIHTDVTHLGRYVCVLQTQVAVQTYIQPVYGRNRQVAGKISYTWAMYIKDLTLTICDWWKRKRWIISRLLRKSILRSLTDTFVDVIPLMIGLSQTSHCPLQYVITFLCMMSIYTFSAWYKSDAVWFK